MANDNSEHPCIFEWRISSPFLPWEPMEATFYSAARTVVQWTVTIWPMVRGLDHWIFSFCLRAEEVDEDDMIQTHRVQIEIFMNENRVAEERLPDYWFEDSNRQTYQFLTNAERPPADEMPVLVVKVEIYLPAPPMKKPAIAWQEDQKQLSDDLYKLVDNGFNRVMGNMKLIPNDVDDDDDDDGGFDVHSYIIYTRWENIFRIHDVPNVDNAQVHINISAGFLSIILEYIYSGKLNFTWFDWRDANTMAQLFEVINRYKLHHMYKIYVKHDSEQLRLTTKDVRISESSVGLDGIYMFDRKFLVPVLYHGNVFFLDMSISRVENGITLSYFVDFMPIIRIDFFQVNLQFVKVVWEPDHGTLRTFRSVHERVYYTRQGEIVRSGEVNVQFDDPIFDDYVSDIRTRGSRQIAHLLNCVFHISDGTSLMQVRNIHDDTIQNDQERFSDLADHMHRLLDNLIYPDLRIECQNKHDNSFTIHRTHKAIFATRVPKHWRVIRDVRGNGDIPEGGDIPEWVTCPFSSEAFEHILTYIYTGKILKFPFHMDEVYRFAQQSEFGALIDLINRMRGQ